MTRGSEKRSVFVPDNNAAKGEWFWVDVPALATAAGLPAETPLVEVRLLLQLSSLMHPSACMHANTTDAMR